MYNLIRADLFKIRKSTAAKILFGITTISAVIMAVMAYLIQQGKIAGSMTGIGFMFSDADVISILGAVIAGVFICGDFDNRTIHDAVASGCGRGTIIVSEAITFFCTLVFILLPYAIVTGIALGTGSKFDMGSVAVSFLNILTSEGGKSFSASELWKLIAIMLTLIIVYLGRLSICIPLALVLKKPILVVAIYYGFTIFCASLTVLINSSKLLGRIWDCTPFGGKYSILTMNTGAGDFFKAIAVSLAFIIVMLVITYSIFRKSEIK